MILKELETVQNRETELEKSQNAQQVLLKYEKADNTSKFWKTIEHCRRVREYQEGELNDITRQFRVLVCGLKRSGAQKSR